MTINEDDSFVLEIDTNEMCLNVQVLGIVMHFDDEGDGNEIKVVWETTGNELIDETVMWDFYLRDAFTERLAEIMQEYGFSKAAAADICTSEAGMQQLGQASYDAYMIGEQVYDEYVVE